MNEVQPPLGSCIAEVDLASGLLFSELISSDHFSIVSLSSSTSYCCVRVLSFQETFPSNNVWIFFHPFAYSQWWYLLSCSDGTWGRQKALLESRNTEKVGVPCFKDSAWDFSALLCDYLPWKPYEILGKRLHLCWKLTHSNARFLSTSTCVVWLLFEDCKFLSSRTVSLVHACGLTCLNIWNVLVLLQYKQLKSLLAS